MAEHFVYLNANVQGIDREMTPLGMSEMPNEQVQMILKSFRDGQTSFRHGMCMVRMNQKQTYYLRACSRSQKASAAEAVCVFADISTLVTDDFTDESLDQHIGFLFPSETNIVNGLTSEMDTRSNPRISTCHFDEKFLSTVFAGCFGRWINGTPPIYISLPNEDFNNHLASVLKSVYLKMPYSLRAHTGYITFPTASYAVPAFVSICFIPESWHDRFGDEPILSWNHANCEKEIEQIIKRSNLDNNTQQYINHIINATDEELQENHSQMYRLIEGNGDVNTFSTLNGRLYGDAFVMLHSWNGYSDEQKDAFLFDFLNRPETPLTEMTWRIIGLHMTNHRLSERIRIATSDSATFSDFVISIKPLFLLKSKLSLDGAWRDALYNFTTRLIEYKNISEMFKSAKSSLQSLFTDDVLKECEQRVIEAHSGFVMDEQKNLENKINEIIYTGRNLGLLDLFKSIYAVSAEVAFDENRKVILSFAIQNISKVFIERCRVDTNFNQYPSLHEAYKALTTTYIQSDNAAHIEWNTYNDRYQHHLVCEFIQQLEDDKIYFNKYLELQKKYTDFISSRRLRNIEISERNAIALTSNWETYKKAYYRKKTDDFIADVKKDSQFEKHSKLLPIYMVLSNPINPYRAEIETCWHIYDTAFKEIEIIFNNPTIYFEMLANGRDYQCNPKWPRVKYSDSLFEFKSKSKGREDIMSSIATRAFEDWKKLSKNPVNINELVDETKLKHERLPALSKRLLRMEALGSENIAIHLPTKELIGCESTVSLNDALELVSWLLSERQRLSGLNDTQLWFAYDLMLHDALCEQDIMRLLGAEVKKKELIPLVMIAAKSILANDDLRGYSALGFLSQKKPKQITPELRVWFLKVAQNDEEGTQRLKKEWKDVVEEAKGRKKTPRSKADKLKLIGILSAIGIVVFLSVMGAVTVFKWFKHDNTPTLPPINTGSSTTTPAEDQTSTEPSINPMSPKITPPSDPICMGDSFVLNVEGIEPYINVFWSSSDDSCVYVFDGQSAREITLKAVTAGTAILQVHRDNIYGEVLAEIIITVEAEEQSAPSPGDETGGLRIEKSKETIYVGEQFTLEIKGIASLSQVFWTSSNFDVITKVSGEATKKVTLYANGTGRALLKVHRDDKDGEVIQQIEITVRKAEN